MRRLFGWIIPALLSLFAVPALTNPGIAADLSGSYSWNPVSIGAGGWVTGFVTHPLDANVRYCRTDTSNAYRWDNTNNVWVPMIVHNADGSGIPASTASSPASAGCDSIAVDPNNTSIIYIAFPLNYSPETGTTNLDNTVYKSTDGGRNFTRMGLTKPAAPNGQWRMDGERMLVDPNNSNVIYYGTLQNGLWRSTDAAVTWTNVTAGGAPAATANLINLQFYKGGGTTSAFGTTVSKVIYAVAGGGDVYRSGDGGQTWSSISTGTVVSGNPLASTMDQNGNFWVVSSNTGNRTLWRYSNAGAWTQIFPGNNNSLVNVLVDPNNANRVFCFDAADELARSLDGGATWQNISAGFNFANTLGWMPQAIAGGRASGGIFFDRNGVVWAPEGNEGMLTWTPSANNTETFSNPPQWTIVSQGIQQFVTQEVIIPKGQADKAFIAIEDSTGITVTDPAAYTAKWVTLQPGILSISDGVAWCPNAPSFVAFSTYDFFLGTGNHSGYSSDGGTTWTHFSSPPTVSSAGMIAISRRGAWGLGSDHMVVLPDNNGLPRYTKDGGQTWAVTSSFPYADGGRWAYYLSSRQLRADPFTPDKYYIKYDVGALCVTTDGGVTWSSLSTGLPNGSPDGDLETNYNVRNDLWFASGFTGATTPGVFHSTDAGVTWTMSSFFSNAFTFALGAGSGQAGDAPYTVYVDGKTAGDPNFGIWRSTNSGVSWDRICYYPAGNFDYPTAMAASWDTYGLVYITFGGSSAAYGKYTGANVPSAPSGFSVTAGNAQVAIAWNASSGATSYNVKRTTVSGSGYVTIRSQATTGYTDTTAANGTTYFYVVTAVNATGQSANTMEIPATPNIPPVAPTGLLATAGDAQVVLSWNATSGATTYNVSRSTVSGSGYASVATGLATTGYTNTGLANGTTYYFVVSGTNAGGTSPNSAQVSSTPQLAPPPAPTGLTAAPGDTQVSLTWTAAFHATSYNVSRSTVSGSGYTVAATGISTVSYTNTGLTNGTTYYFVVSGTDAAGTGSNSAQASALPGVLITGTWYGTPGSWGNFGNVGANAFDGNTTTFSDLPDANGDYTGLDVGSGNTATVTTIRYLCRDLEGSRMVGGQFQGTNGDPVTGPYTTFFTPVTEPTDGIWTTVTVSAAGYRYLRYLSPNNGYCDVAEIQFRGAMNTGSAPPAPTGLTATAGDTQVALSWTAVGGATSYNVKRSTVNGAGYAQVTNVATAGYTNTGLTNGTIYYFVVTALNSGGESVNSAQASATPTAVPPAQIAFASTAPVIDGAVDSVWSGATSYTMPNVTGTIPGGAINTGSWQALWDATNLYVLVTMQDSTVLANNDGIEVYVDGNNGKATTYTSVDWQWAFTNGGGIQEYQSGTLGGNTTGILQGQAAITGGWRLEANIPWSTIGVSAVSGNNIGLDIAYNNYNVAGTRANKLFWFSTTDNDWSNPSLFGTAKLMAGGGSPPAAPTGLTATPGNAQVALSWTASSGATSYNALRSTVSGSGYASVATGIATTSYTNTGLTNGITYYFVVTATNAGGTSANSAEAAATPVAGSMPVTEPFNYAAGSLPTVSSGKWTGPTTGDMWSVANSGVGTGSLQYTKNAHAFTGSGLAAVATISTVGEMIIDSYTLPSVINASSSTTGYIYVGALMAFPGAQVNWSGLNVQLWKGNGTGGAYTDELALFGLANEANFTLDYGENTGSGLPTTNTTVSMSQSVSQATFMVARLDFTNNLIRFFINPDPGAATPVGNSDYDTGDIAMPAGNLPFQTIKIERDNNNTGNAWVDEIRIADTFTGLVNGGSAPAAPTGLTATPGNAQVVLTWNASAGATAYDVKRSTVSGSGYVTVSSPTVTNYTNTGLTNGTIYYFVVDAKNAAGTSANSAQASATPTGAPPAPTGLTATPGNAQVALNWNTSTGATAYDVKRSTVSGSGYATVSSPTVANYTNTGLTNGTTYYFVVDAKNASGTSANSAQVSGTPVAPPAAPTGLTGTPGNAQVVLSWTASSGATSYNALRSTVSGSGYASVATGIGTTNYTNTGLTNGTAYYFVVTATNAGGTSANSAQASATPVAPPAAPTALTAAAGNTQVALSWTASTGATTYNVLRSTVSGSGYASVVTGVAVTNYTNTGLTNGTTYYFVVTATNAGGTSANSAQASATPVAVPQAQIIAGTATIDGTVEAAWNSATAYALNKTAGTITNSADCSATWKGMWDATNLYILASVTDDLKVNDSVNPWDDDSVEIYLDADHNGGTTYDANDRQVVCGWGDAAAVEGAGRAIAGVTFAKADPTGTTYVIEAKIPWAVEAFTPAANGIIGIDVHINDDDDGAARDGKVIWNDGTDMAWSNPSLFGTGKLLPPAIPSAPTGLTATPGNAQIALSWTASSGATSYNALRSTVNGSGYASVATGIGTTTYTNTGLTNGTAYYFVVTATNAGGTSGNSNQASATPVAPQKMSEPFSWSAGSLPTVSGGKWTGPTTGDMWSVANSGVGTGSLQYTKNAHALNSAGLAAMATITTAGEDIIDSYTMGSGITSASTTTGYIYISALMAFPGAQVNWSSLDMQLWKGNGTGGAYTDELAFIGLANEANFTLDYGSNIGTGLPTTNTTISMSQSVSQATFVVIRIDFTNNLIRFFINPDPGATTPVGNSDYDTGDIAMPAGNLPFQTIKIERQNTPGGNGWIDEIRIADTFTGLTSSASPLLP